jgi:ectoine hydroxylase-related dioxygenase (phytanoyl-CoA dioxygenase family)
MDRFAIYDTDAMLAALERDGYACVSEALPRELCAEARAKIDTLEPRHWDESHRAAHGGNGRCLDRYLCVFERDPYWLPFLDRPGIIDLAETALGRDCHVIGETAWRSHPGFRGEPLHVDYLPLTWPEDALPEAVRVPAFVLTAHFYLNDVTADLAPTRIVAGSHRAGRAPRPGEEQWKGCEPGIVLARTGDALVFRSDVWHAGSDNASECGVRYLLQVHYGRREMAQHCPAFSERCLPPAVLACASARHRRLLGDHDPGAYD